MFFDENSVLILLNWGLSYFENFMTTVFYGNTGCPAKHVPLLFFEFLGFLGV